jgi:hypothetical protein
VKKHLVIKWGLHKRHPAVHTKIVINNLLFQFYLLSLNKK